MSNDDYTKGPKFEVGERVRMSGVYLDEGSEWKGREVTITHVTPNDDYTEEENRNCFALYKFAGQSDVTFWGVDESWKEKGIEDDAFEAIEGGDEEKEENKVGYRPGDKYIITAEGSHGFEVGEVVTITPETDSGEPLATTLPYKVGDKTPDWQYGVSAYIRPVADRFGDANAEPYVAPKPTFDEGDRVLVAAHATWSSGHEGDAYKDEPFEAVVSYGPDGEGDYRVDGIDGSGYVDPRFLTLIEAEEDIAKFRAALYSTESPALPPSQSEDEVLAEWERELLGLNYEPVDDDDEFDDDDGWVGEDERFEPEVDVVNHPPHYNFANGVEVIDLTEQLSFNGGNAVKYISRATRQDGAVKGNVIEDLEKARWYIEREIYRLTD